MRVLTALAAVAALLAAGCATEQPRLAFGSDTPDDLRALAAETFAEVVAALPAHRDCLAGVTLEGARRLDDRATYRPDDAVVILRIPATAGQLRTSLVHELAHHLEHTCPAQEPMRAAFLRASGHARDAPWFDGRTWAQTPSEQFAGALVAHVLGRRDRVGGAHVRDAAIAVVAAWSEGRITHAPATP